MKISKDFYAVQEYLNVLKLSQMSVNLYKIKTIQNNIKLNSIFQPLIKAKDDLLITFICYHSIGES